MSIIYAHINNAAPAEYKALDDALASMFSFFGKVSRVGERDLPFLSLREQISRVLEAIRMCISALGRVDAERKGTGKTDDIRSGGSSEGFSSERHYCFELRSALEEVSTLCESTGAQAANNPAFLLRGLAGTGKTHLFCDVAQRRVRNGLPTFIFLGEEFTDRNPWAVMTGLLGRSTGPTTFLEILNEYGRRRRTRVLMMIDALNEAPIKVDWSALLQARPYRYIAIAVSIRTGFERQILRQSCLDQFVRDEHRGFEFREWE